MPTYEYICKGCGSSFEIFQNMRDEPLKLCPECGREIRRVINGGGGVIFKGTGFYVTDKTGAQNKDASVARPKLSDKNETAKHEIKPSTDADKKQKHEEKEAG
ncbi:MAG: zinc ribbon domain-containing protein [Treponema sp.]|jgi:putative FmdB family regulatory protein|nr:zinc ribbon domain-containing protein [Treponema sp.]